MHKNTLYFRLLKAKGQTLEFNFNATWLSYGCTPLVLWVVVLLQIKLPQHIFSRECDYLKHFMVRVCSTGFTLLRSALRSVSWCCRRSSGLCSRQPKSIILKEFTVSNDMASALGRLEKYRGNATLHGFLDTIDLCSQSLLKPCFKRTRADTQNCLGGLLMSRKKA